MPVVKNIHSWEVVFRKDVRKISNGWTVRESPRSKKIMLKVNGYAVTLPFAWNELNTGDAYIRIRNIYNLTLEGHDLKTAADIAAGNAPKLTHELDWNGALIAFRKSLTTVGPKTWKNKYQASLNRAIKIAKESRSISNGVDLSEETLKQWLGKSEQFDISRRALWRFLKFCVYRRQFKPIWLPPVEIPSAGKRQPKKIGYPISDIQFLTLIESIQDQRWIFAFMLCCVYGLRPEELRYLHTRNDGKELWSGYTKSKGGTSGDCTEPRQLHPVLVRDSDGSLLDWNLLQRFHIGEKLPSLGQPGDAGQYLRRYLRNKPIWKSLRKQAKAEGQSLVPYSFRHRYSKQLHLTHLTPKQIADAMGHQLKTHLNHYARFMSDDLTEAFELVNTH